MNKLIHWVCSRESILYNQKVRNNLNSAGYHNDASHTESDVFVYGNPLQNAPRLATGSFT